MVPTSRTKRRAAAAAFALMLGAAVIEPAIAQSQHSTNDLHVLRVFSEGQSRAGFFTTENIAANCLWNLMYIDLATPTGRGQLALLMQAKAQGLRLQRVDYSKNVPGYPAGTCLATGIHVEVASPVPAACTAGYIAIPNNNKHLVATALMSKASSSRVSVYFVDDHGSNHCPGRVFTPCSVISIESN